MRKHHPSRTGADCGPRCSIFSNPLPLPAALPGTRADGVSDFTLKRSKSVT